MIDQELQKLIEEFIKKTGFDYSNLSVGLDSDAGSYWVSMTSKDTHSIIGKDGEMIQSINHLLKRMVESKYKDNSPRVLLDINNYHKERIDKIKTVAHMMSERARFFKSRIELEPMNAFERRIVHDYVGGHSDLASESSGVGKNRRVVIFYKSN